MVNIFQVGDWKNYLKTNEEWDKWIEEHMQGTNIEMDFIA